MSSLAERCACDHSQSSGFVVSAPRYRRHSSPEERRRTAHGLHLHYDRIGNRLSETAEPGGNTTNYTYDSLYRPTDVHGPHGPRSYAYGLAGSRTVLTEDGIPVFCAVNVVHGYGTVGGETRTHDASENLLSQSFTKAPKEAEITTVHHALDCPNNSAAVDSIVDAAYGASGAAGLAAGPLQPCPSRNGGLHTQSAPRPLDSSHLTSDVLFADALGLTSHGPDDIVVAAAAVVVQWEGGRRGCGAQVYCAHPGWLKASDGTRATSGRKRNRLPPSQQRQSKRRDQ